MAKVLQVSDDSGSNWFTLPGAEAAFNNSGDPIDDTILGQTFSSALTGLIGWSMTGTGLYKGFAGYLAKILQVGSATSQTGEAMTLVSGKTYQINDTAKRIWDRSATVTVYDNAVDHTADVVDIDYLFGKVTFDAAYSVTGPVTIDVDTFATSQLGKGKSFTLTQTMEPIDNTDYATAQANGGYKTFIAGLRTVALELSGIFDATVNSKDDLKNRNELIVEIDPVGTGESIARGFFRMIDTGQSGAVGALEEETINLALNVPADDLISTVFAWQHNNTTLPTAVEKVLTAWETETSLDGRYLPSGTPGQTPLDGASGEVWVSDVTLTGSLTGMNEFNATLQGSGTITEV